MTRLTTISFAVMLSACERTAAPPTHQNAAPPPQSAAGNAAPPPALPLAAPPATTTTIPPSGTPAPPSAASCAQQFPSPQLAGCKWSIGTFARCGGAVPRPGEPTSSPGCVCNGCTHDADCTAKSGGRCVDLPGNGCTPTAKACVYAGDPCSPGGSCAAPSHCANDGGGNAVCRKSAGKPP